MALMSHKFLALKPLPSKEKVETVMTGNIALVSQKSSVIEAELAMDFKMTNGLILRANKDKVIIPGDAAFQGFAKQIYNYNGLEFIRASEDHIVGYITGE
jgi:imidazoleglycerol phosphate synthase glutamine amidotransferase subunit HisH